MTEADDTEYPMPVSVALLRARGFVPISYLIDQGKDAPIRVSGYAFDIPDWPEFHACVRWDSHWSWGEKHWMADHYETGRALSDAGRIEDVFDAPSMIAKLLKSKTRKVVALRLQREDCK